MKKFKKYFTNPGKQMSFHKKSWEAKHERSNFTTKLYKKKKKIEVAYQIERTLSNMVHDQAKITNKLRIQTGEFV